MRDLYDLLVQGELRVATQKTGERGEDPYVALTVLFRDGHVLELLREDACDEPGVLMAHRRRVAERVSALRRQVRRLSATLDGGVLTLSAASFVVMLLAMDMDAHHLLRELAWRTLVSMMVAMMAAAARYGLKRWLRARLGIR